MYYYMYLISLHSLILEMVKLREEQKRELLSTTIKVLETRLVPI